MTSLIRKVTWWLQRRRKEDELREELQFHLAEEFGEGRADGLPEDEARWRARRDLGNLTILREDARTVWSWVLLEQLAQDVRYGLRAMRRNTLFTALAALSLALGIGANTAIYSFMDAILLRALPVSDPGSLVTMQWQSRPPNPAASDQFVMHSMDGSTYDDRSGVTAAIFPFPAFEHLQDASAVVLSSLFAHKKAGGVTVRIQGQAELAQGDTSLAVELEATGRRGSLRGDVAGLGAELEPSEVPWAEGPFDQQSKRPRGVAAAAIRRKHAIPEIGNLGGPTLRSTIVPTTSPVATSTMVSRPNGPTSHSSSERAACSVIVGSDGTLSLNCQRTASAFVSCSMRAGASARVRVRSERTPSVIPSAGTRGSAAAIESPRSVGSRPNIASSAGPSGVTAFPRRMPSKRNPAFSATFAEATLPTAARISVRETPARSNAHAASVRAASDAYP